ncbi:c-type cytochrome [Sphaerotilus sp.]|uniref:cytochrome c/ABC transporter substrate-binding protein n=1 Tax=Sphaerotilus sp. TaxID=2093942 RepID=UPI0034E1C30E
MTRQRRTGGTARAVGWCLLSGALGWATPARTHTPVTDHDPDIALGAQLYRDGLGADRRPLQADRVSGVSVQGRQAACIQCHRASGMGGAEGSTAVPPIAGSVLFAPGQPAHQRTARVFARLARQTPASESRPAYALDTLQRALNEGIAANGQAMDPLMPRYRLTEDEVRAIAAYTTTMQVGTAPGYAEHTLHLATIETSDNLPAVRQAGPALLARCLAERSPPQADDPGGPPAWTLHRWTLGPDPLQWSNELASLQHDQPVFAIVSGTTGPTGRGPWQAVQQHCEREALPCVLPNTAAVDDLQPSDWTFHFSRGISLDAAAMASALTEQAPADGWRAVHLVVDPQDEAASLGAQRLLDHLASGPTAGVLVVVHRPDAADTAVWLSRLGARDALALWLPAPALQDWTAQHTVPASGPRALVSGELIELDPQSVSPAWRGVTQVTWPYDPLERHLPRVARNVGQWLDTHQLPLAETPALIRLQGHTYSACEVAANALRRMGRRVSRGYLLELLEGAEEAATATAYPRFTLGPGRRHGSQGTWLMRFGNPPQARLQPVGDWFVPE